MGAHRREVNRFPSLSAGVDHVQGERDLVSSITAQFHVPPVVILNATSLTMHPSSHECVSFRR